MNFKEAQHSSIIMASAISTIWLQTITIIMSLAPVMQNKLLVKRSLF